MLDKERLIHGQIFDEDYFEHLISQIQKIRASERRFFRRLQISMRQRLIILLTAR